MKYATKAILLAHLKSTLNSVNAAISRGPMHNTLSKEHMIESKSKLKSAIKSLEESWTRN